MTLSVVPYGIEHKSFAEKHFNFVVSPVLRREGLQEHDDTLANLRYVILRRQRWTYLEIHLPELFAPLDEECRAYIKVELRECIRSFSLGSYNQ